MGWRYVFFSLGGLVFLMSVARVTVMSLKETPKYLLGQGRDDDVAGTLQWMAQKYHRQCSLTAEQLYACGVIDTSKSKKGKLGVGELIIHLRGLFLTRQMALSTSLIWLSWTLIGLAYPLYQVFLPDYLASRGAQTGSASNYITWRNYAIIQMCGIWGPVLAGMSFLMIPLAKGADVYPGFLCEVRFLGRRGTMVVGALVTSIAAFL